MLSRNTSNRRPSASRINHLSNQMGSGEWIYNGETIIVDSDDNLIDGQHRLLACIHSGSTFTTELITGIEDSRAFATIDTGKARTGSDVLFIKSGTKCAPKLSAMLKIIDEYCLSLSEGRDFKLMRPKYTNNKVLKLYKKYDHALFLSEKLSSRKYSSSVLSGIWVIYSINKELAEDVIRMLDDGVFTSPHCPIKKLYDLCLTGFKGCRSANVMTSQIALTIKSINAYENGQKGKLLRWQPKEPFPKPNNFGNFPKRYYT